MMDNLSCLRPHPSNGPFAPLGCSISTPALDHVRVDPSSKALSLRFAVLSCRRTDGFSLMVSRGRYARGIAPVRSEMAASAGSYGVPSQLRSETQLISRVRGICFYAVTAITAVPLFIVMVLAHPFVMILDRHRRAVHHLVAKVWARLTIAPFYRVEFEGLENLPPLDVPSVYVSNHGSFLDIYTLLTLGRTFKFISKRAIFLFPIIGWAMFLMGLIPLRRVDTRSQLMGVCFHFFPCSEPGTASSQSFIILQINQCVLKIAWRHLKFKHVTHFILEEEGNLFLTVREPICCTYFLGNTVYMYFLL